MNTHQKQTFTMPIADNVRLVTLETARACLGITAEKVVELVEDHSSPQHLPAFDFSIKGNSRRELRIWSRALSGNQRRDPETVIADCLLTNVAGLQNEHFNVNNSQLELAWCVSNQMLLEFIKHQPPLVTGIRVGRNWRVNRFSAAKFLRTRMQ